MTDPATLQDLVGQARHHRPGSAELFAEARTAVRDLPWVLIVAERAAANT